MDDEQIRIDRELADLGARWRAENPADFVPRDFRRDDRPSTLWLVSGVAAAVVIAVVIGSIVLTPGKHRAGPSGPPPDVVSRLDCARPVTRAVTGAPVVPDGAVAARICGRAATGAGFDSAWPGDTLTGAAAGKLADEVNTLTPYAGGTGGKNQACGHSVPFELVLRYADGTRVWVHGRGAQHCDEVAVQGGGRWADATRVSDRALELIDQQRSASTTPRTPIPPQCPLKWGNVAGTIGAGPVQAQDAVAVTACQYRLDRGARSFASGHASGRLDLQAVVNEPAGILATAVQGRPINPCGTADFTLATVQRVLILRDSFGDIQVVSTAPCWPDHLTGTTQYPSAALITQVADLFGAS